MCTTPFRLEWTGAADHSYVIQYEDGEGWKAFSGEMQVTGTMKDFGAGSAILALGLLLVCAGGLSIVVSPLRYRGHLFRFRRRLWKRY